MRPKHLHVSPAFDRDTLDAVTKAEAALERILGKSGSEVEVTWEPPPRVDQDDPVARVTLTHAGITKEFDFYAWEFPVDMYVRAKLRELWDEVLSERGEVLRRSIHESLAGSEGE